MHFSFFTPNYKYNEYIIKFILGPRSNMVFTSFFIINGDIDNKASKIPEGILKITCVPCIIR